MPLWLFSEPEVNSVIFAGFDGYNVNQNDAYSDSILQSNLTIEEKIMLNNDIESMLEDFIKRDKGKIKINFLTNSQFQHLIGNYQK